VLLFGALLAWTMISVPRVLVLAVVACCCWCVSQANLVIGPAEGGNRGIRSSITNNSFDFLVYKKHPRFTTFDECFSYIYDNYLCRSRPKAIQFIKEFVQDQDYSSDLSFLDQCRSLPPMKAAVDRNPKYRYIALLLLLTSSRSFSTEISIRGTPGIWSCFFDYLVDEFKIIRDKTERDKLLYEDGQLMYLYSGIQDSCVYNMTDGHGKINVAIGQMLTVSGFFSTTTRKQIALKYAKGISGSACDPSLMVVKPLAQGSMAAYVELIAATGEEEMLYPTNVKMKIVDIISRDDGRMEKDVYDSGFVYEIVVEETPTQSIATEVDGSDPRSGEYYCEDDSNSSDSDSSSPASSTIKSSVSEQSLDSANRHFSFAVVFLLLLSILTL